MEGRSEIYDRINSKSLKPITRLALDHKAGAPTRWHWITAGVVNKTLALTATRPTWPDRYSASD
ncbi:hypothetical protein HPP92_020231 [Vanilla planifolia]|uniref:Uncharacterized protein n=1 Tax=Vanilla planifolia TaxID=51239 RepID=A0A835UET1_VANPL|nr:hypothetical protein HPP92_020641 [Vanilla planifolia]KAG0461755.1 hypothetical protein HPP92_020231 [Vanilla planifolia]